MFPYRPHQQIMVDIVKESLDVEVKYPVVSPAPLTCNPYGLNRRLSWPIPIRVRIEIFFQDWLQVSFNYRLGNAVCHCWYSQWPGFPIVLRYIDPTYGWWKIAARGHPIPDLKEVIFQILFKFCNGLPVYSGRSFVSLHQFVGFPYFPF